MKRSQSIALGSCQLDRFPVSGSWRQNKFGSPSEPRRTTRDDASSCSGGVKISLREGGGSDHRSCVFSSYLNHRRLRVPLEIVGPLRADSDLGNRRCFELAEGQFRSLAYEVHGPLFVLDTWQLNNNLVSLAGDIGFRYAYCIYSIRIISMACSNCSSVTFICWSQNDLNASLELNPED